MADADAEVRLQSPRAVGRIDPAFARGLSSLAALQSNPDARVASVAARLAAQ